MAGPFYVYSEADLYLPYAVGGTGTTSPLLEHDLLYVSDDDPFLDAPVGVALTDGNQTLASRLFLDGPPVANINDLVYATGRHLTIATSTGEVIDLYNIFTIDQTTGTATDAGLVSTARLFANEAYTITAITHTGGVAYSQLAPCFTQGTLIECENGPIAVQDIVEGDLVVTRKNGLQAVRWAGGRTVAGVGEMAPICFKAGVVGNAIDMRFSPMHRLLMSGPRAEVLFGKGEVLAHAAHLCDGDRIFREPCAEVAYFHILFDHHEIIRAHGCWSESFAPSEAALNAVGEQTRAELLKLFPELDQDWCDALPTLSAAEAQLAI